MLSSIHPFGERSRNSRWWLTISAYLMGSVLGGASLGLTLGLLGMAVRSFLSVEASLLLLAAAALVGLAADLGLGGLRRPSIHRQVNERWLTRYRGWIYGLGFGYQLGLGVVTIVTTSLVWVTWLAAALTGSWLQGLIIGATFGLARGSFIFTTARVHEPAKLRDLHRRIDQQAGAVHRFTLVSTVMVAAGAATAGLLHLPGLS